ncbi:hypothetical protein J4714_12785 [Staphylococcus epidermidis]|nr:hypothetical protein [Staphylococcus epidermidis]
MAANGPLRQSPCALINDYNAVPRQEQPALLKELLHNETFIEGVQALMDEQRSNYRDDDLGLSF